MTSVFFDLLEIEEKEGALAEAVSALSAGNESVGVTFVSDQDSFGLLPGSPIAYWIDLDLRRQLSSLPRFESEGREARIGDHPSDDFRYLRLSWEPAFDRTTLKWIPYQKGGDFSRYFYDLPLVVDWDASRQTYRGFYGRKGRSSERPSNFQYFFRPGLTWPRRSQRGFSVRALPSNSIFADKGPSVFVDGDHRDVLLAILAVMNSAVFRSLLEIQVAFGSYEVGAVQRSPFPDLEPVIRRELASLAIRAYEYAQAAATTDETSHSFAVPSSGLFFGTSESLQDVVGKATLELSDLDELQEVLDLLVGELYGFDEQTLATLCRHSGSDEESYGEAEPGELEEKDESETNQQRHSPVNSIQDVLSWSVGCALGRWDIRIALDPSLELALQDPFEPLPVCSPGMLVGTDGLPAKPTGIVSEEWMRARPDVISLPPEGSVAQPTIPDADYPLRIDWDGILVDDEGHPDDIVGRVREVFSLLWPERVEAIEREACEILGVADLREYFRNPRRFWDFHIKRYSKSRRKAPIYWLLQSAKRSYGLWLYYHRMDADILYKAVRIYVDPKINRERHRLDELESGRAAAEAAGGRTRREHERHIDRQRAFLTELEEFRQTLERVAMLDLTVDHDDGVLLSIAPLHELVPWKPAAQAWNELVAGKYEWSTMAKRMQEKGLVRGSGRQ